MGLDPPRLFLLGNSEPIILFAKISATLSVLDEKESVGSSLENPLEPIGRSDVKEVYLS